MINEEMICNDIDKVISERAKTLRTFPDVINEWTDTVLKENAAAMNTETILLITRLGALGQALIYEANNIGMIEVAAMRKG